MSDGNTAQERRQAQNRKAQQAYRKREASRAARVEAQRKGKDEPRNTSNEITTRSRPRASTGQQNSPHRQTFEFVFQQQSPGQSSLSPENEWLTNCMPSMQQLQPNEAFEFPALSSEDFLVSAPPAANGFQATVTSAELQQRQSHQQRPDSFGQTTLHLAAMKNFAPVCQRLIRYGASLEAREETGRTPLHVAASSGFVEVVTTLIAGGAFVDAEDAMGMTPLCLAVNNGHEAVVEVLLSNGADPNQRVNG